MITVIGLGFVGLTTALGFSRKGFRVYGLDIDSAKVEALQKYELPFYEPHLKQVLREELGGRFVLNSTLREAVNDSQAIILCVGTPGNADGSANIDCLLKAIETVFSVADTRFKVIVTKSTVPPSTLSSRVKPFVDQLSAKSGKNIGLASNPEFLREGSAWEDFMEPDRVVVGVEDEASRQILEKLYRPFNAPVYYVNYNLAEFIKYLSNTLLSTMISFANEMAMIADHIGDIDVPAAFRILHMDRRWSGSPAPMANYVFPGCGYGGYCLPKDTAALNSIAKENGFTPKILEGNLRINEEIQEFVARKISRAVPRDRRIGVLGLSFKDGSDDVRFSPSMFIIRKLLEMGHSDIIAYDPMANAAFASEYNLPIAYADSLEGLVDEADALVLFTKWHEFRQKRHLFEGRRLLDFRHMLSEFLPQREKLHQPDESSIGSEFPAGSSALRS